MTAMEAYNEAFATRAEDLARSMDEKEDLVRLIDERIQKALEPVSVVLRQIIKDEDNNSSDLDKHHDWLQDLTRHVAALQKLAGATQRNRQLYRYYLSTLP